MTIAARHTMCGRRTIRGKLIKSNRSRNNSRPLRCALVVLLSIAMLFSLPTTDAAVTILKGITPGSDSQSHSNNVTNTDANATANPSFASLPAVFGTQWQKGIYKHARLHFIEDRPRMCSQDAHTGGIPPSIMSPTTTGDVPIALLVERKGCTFLEKAVQAYALSASIQYVIIYDDKPNDDLTIMGSDTALKGNAPLFVSYTSGMELRREIRKQANATDGVSEGIMVELDGVPMFDPAAAGRLSLTGYLLAALMGFLAFMLFFACILLCAQTGLISLRTDARGRVFIVTGRRGSNIPIVGRMIQSGVLTEAQVATLKEEAFHAETTSGDTSTTRRTATRASKTPMPSTPSLQQGGNPSNSLDGNTNVVVAAIDGADKVGGVGIDLESNCDSDRDSNSNTLDSSANEGSRTDPSTVRAIDTSASILNNSNENANENGDNGNDDDMLGSAHCCAICLDTFEEGEMVKVLPCNHRFHGDCVVPWLTERHPNCPLCKFDVLAHIMAHSEQQASAVSDDSQSSSDAELSGASRSGGGARCPFNVFAGRGFAPLSQRSNTPPPASSQSLPLAAPTSPRAEVEMETMTPRSQRSSSTEV